MRPISVEIRNEAIDGKRIRDVKPLLNRAFVISRIRHTGSQETELANADTVLHMQDEILFIANPKDVEAIVAFFGRKISVEWEREDKNLISRRILITKPELNGKSLSQLKIRNNFGAWHHPYQPFGRGSGGNSPLAVADGRPCDDCRQ